MKALFVSNGAFILYEQSLCSKRTEILSTTKMWCSLVFQEWDCIYDGHLQRIQFLTGTIVVSRIF